MTRTSSNPTPSDTLPRARTPGPSSPQNSDGNGPRFPQVGVLALVPDWWGPEWQARHHVLTRLARHFQVLWVNPARNWRERDNPDHPDGAGANLVSIPPGFDVYTPERWLPLLYRPTALARWTLSMRLRRARARLIARGATKIVLYIWRPEFAPALKYARYDASSYHIDDEYTFSPVDIPTSEAERGLIAAVDQVFIHSAGLMEKKGDINPNTDEVPLGVDYDRYAANLPEPPDLAAIPSPRVGYIGVLKRTIDWSLLQFLSEQRPEWSIVLMGPRTSIRKIEAPIRELSRLPNVFILPGRPTSEIAAYPQHLDVCLLPYQANDYAKYGYPLKLHEYLAGGRPVVGTRMRSLEDFTDVITLASTPEEWLAGIGRALQREEQSLPRVAARRTVARAHDWQVLVDRIAARIAARLGGEVAAGYAEAAGIRVTPPQESSKSATPWP